MELEGVVEDHAALPLCPRSLFQDWESGIFCQAFVLLVVFRSVVGCAYAGNPEWIHPPLKQLLELAALGTRFPCHGISCTLFSSFSSVQHG